MVSQQLSSFPFSSTLALCIVLTSHGYSLTSIFPYVGYMVLSFGTTDDRDKTGYYAGYITGAFMMGRFAGSYFWGHWSDIHGRKPTLYIGLGANLIFSLFFGFSTTMWFAIFSRFCLGLFNGIVATCKVFVSEICEKEHEVKGMGIITGCWSLSYVLGPAVGGLLADPCTQYPSIFGSVVLFQNYPYLLPNIVSSILAALSLIAVMLYVPETVPHCKSICLFPSANPKNTKNEYVKLNDCQSDNFGSISGGKSSNGTCMKDGMSACAETSALLENELKNGSCNGYHKNLLEQKNKDVEFHVEKDTLSEGVTKPKDEQTSMVLNLMRMIAVPTARNILLCFMYYSFLVVMFDEVYPLWALSTVQSGGLDWTSGTIGKALSIAGVFMALFQFLVYPQVVKSLGYVKMQKVTSILAIPLYISFPFISYLQSTPTVLFVVLVLNMVLIKILANMIFTSISLITNNSVPTSLRGGLNGVSMTLGSLGQALAPPAGSLLFAYSISSGSAIPLVDYHLSFNVSALLSVIFAVGSWLCFSTEKKHGLDSEVKLPK